MKSKWVPTLGYTVAWFKERGHLVMRLGCDYYPPHSRPAWREYAAASDADAAWSICDALNANLGVTEGET